MDCTKPLSTLPDEIENRFRTEAAYLLAELKACTMDVVLVPAPDPHFTGHMIRTAQGTNPAWHSAFFWDDPENYRRWRTVRALTRFLKKKDRLNNSYDNRLRALMYTRLVEGYDVEGYWIEPELKEVDFE